MSDALSDEELANIKGRVDAATQAPWVYWDNRGKATGHWVGYHPPKFVQDGTLEGECHQGVLIGDVNRVSGREADCLFISSARHDVPRLLKEIRRLKQHNVELQEAYKRAVGPLKLLNMGQATIRPDDDDY